MITKLETQLDKFIEVTAEGITYLDIYNNAAKKQLKAEFIQGANLLKPMVLKLVSSLEQVSAGREKYQTRVEMDVSDMKELANEALNELTKMLGQGE